MIIKKFVENIKVAEAWQFLNENMLYNRHLGFKGSIKAALLHQEEKALKLHQRVEIVKNKVLEENIFEIKAVYQFFKVKSEGNSILVFDDKTNLMLEKFDFPRQQSGENLCLADLVLANQYDNFCIMVVTAGGRVRQFAQEMLETGLYLDQQILYSLAFETAEASAEYIHKKIRDLWGINDDPSLTLTDILQGKYIGNRFSLGYPACPNLEDQQKIWRLLDPKKEIGVSLTENFMMHPEASVSAIVFYNPSAKYFGV